MATLVNPPNKQKDRTEAPPALQAKILPPFLSEETLGTTSTREGQGHLQRQLARGEGALWTTEVGNTWQPVPASGLPAGGEGERK